MKSRKGEMTTQQIVMLIVLIASFAVILFFLLRLNLGSENEKEICHNSVVTRGSAVVPTDAFPLECRRSYVCLTKDGSCEAMTKPDKKKVKTEEEVYGVLADELATCWWMYGEGKVNYVGKDYFKNLYCSICSQIAFDDSVNEIFTSGSFSQTDLKKYLVENNRSEGVKYFDYLYGSVGFVEGEDYGTISLDKQYYVLTAITSEISNLGWIVGAGTVAATVAGVVVSSVASGGTLIPVWVAVGVAGTAAGVAGGFGGDYIATFLKGKSGQNYLRPELIEIGSEEFNGLECDSLASLS